MIDTREDRKTEKPEMAEAAEEVQVYGEAQTINENSGSSMTDETGEEETLPESSSEPSAEEQAAEMKDRLLRALADVENTRRRSARDVEDARKYASSGLARDLLNVSDNLRRGLEAVGGDVQEGDEAINNLKKRLQFVQRRQPHRPIPPSTVTRGQCNAASRHQRRRRLVETGAPGRPDVVRNS